MFVLDHVRKYACTGEGEATKQIQNAKEEVEQEEEEEFSDIDDDPEESG